MASLFIALGTALTSALSTAGGAAAAGSTAAAGASSLGSIMSTAAMGSTILGTGLSIVGQMNAAGAAKDQAAWQAKALERRANESRAIGQKQMFEKRRQTNMALSRLNALAAAGGGDTTDPTIENLGSGIAERGEYAALSEFYSGENRARGYQDQAAAAIYKGKAAAQASNMKAFGTLFDGIGTFAKQYKSFGYG